MHGNNSVYQCHAWWQHCQQIYQVRSKPVFLVSIAQMPPWFLKTDYSAEVIFDCQCHIELAMGLYPWKINQHITLQGCTLKIPLHSPGKPDRFRTIKVGPSNR